jgi:hypothetical protein
MQMRNNMKKIINEGLKAGDLENMVLPLLTIDEYNSKIDNSKNIVVGFYVFEQDAAYDLSNFIERSPYLIQDTDVSPAPTKDGYYLTFAEIQRNLEFPKALVNLLQEVTLLCNIKNWQFTAPNLKKDQIVDLSKENLQKYIDTKIYNPKLKNIEECFEFFADSMLTDILLEENHLQIKKRNTKNDFQFVEITNDTPSGVFHLDESSASACLVIEKMLGGPYSVYYIGDNIVIENTILDKFLILK